MSESTQRPDEYEAQPQGGTSPETGTAYDPTGEPETTPHDQEIAEVNEDSNPNAASSAGLAGDMGVSSERTEFDGIEGTGNVGSAARPGGTDGMNPTTGEPLNPSSPQTEGLTDVAAHENHRGKNPGHSHG